MTIEKRNEWLVDHLEHIEKTVKRFCDRHEECTYDEMYSDVIMWLIGRLDEDDGSTFTDISKSKLTMMVCNKLNAFKKAAPSKEDPVDPSTFELIYTPDFYSNIIPWECNKVKMDPDEKDIFFNYTFGNYTFKELGSKYGNTLEWARQTYMKACSKVLKNYYRSNRPLVAYYRFEGTAKISAGNIFIPVNVSALIKSETSKVEAVRKKYAFNHLKCLIAEKMDVLYKNVFMEDIVLTDTILSERSNAEDVDLKYNIEVFERQKNYLNHLSTWKCDYVLKVSGWLVGRYNYEFAHTVSIRKKEYLPAANYTEAEAIKAVIANSLVDAMLLAKEHNLKNPIILSPLRTRDVDARLVRLEYD